MSSPANFTREQAETQRGEWEGFGTAGTCDSHEPEKKGIAGTVTETAGNLASEAGHKAEEAVGAVGSGMRSAAQSIRAHAPQSGMAGSAASAVAQTLEKGGHYLEHDGLKGIGNDLTDLIRKNPVPALLVGIGIGFLVARATRS